MVANRFVYTSEMEEWLSSTPLVGAKLVSEFNKVFKTNKHLHCLECKKNYLKGARGKNKGLKQHSSEQDAWIIENYYKLSRNEFIRQYNKIFRNIDVTDFRGGVGRCVENYAYALLKKTGNYKGKRPKEFHERKYFDEEMLNWVIENKSKMTTKELLDGFNKTFNKEYKNYDTLKKIFYDKGRKLTEGGKSIVELDSKYGNLPVGSIIKWRKYYYIKVKDIRNHDVRMINHNRNIVNDPRFIRHDLYVLGLNKLPKDKVVYHLNENTLDDRKENLCIVSKRTLAGLVHYKSGNKEINKTLISVYEVKEKLEELENGKQ